MRILDPEIFYGTLSKKKPGKEYLQLIEKARKQEIGPTEKVEIHHIQPVSLGGPDIGTNKVPLTIFQHCLAHLLIAKCFSYPEPYFVLNKMSGKHLNGLSDLEKITLEEVYKWTETRSALRDSLRGSKCVIYNPETGIVKRVLKEEVQEWLDSGFELGVPPDKKLANKFQNKGRITIGHDDLKLNKMVFQKDLQNYLNKGWHLGRCKDILNKLKGKIPVYKDEVEKHVQSEEVEKYLKEGWIKGTGEKQRVNHGKAMKGKIRLYLEGQAEGIMVNPEDLDSYLAKGYKRGRSQEYKDKLKELHRIKRLKHT